MMRANRQQACAVFAMTRHQFDEAVAAGFPAEKASRSRGEDWSVDLAAAHRWLVARAVAEAGLAASGEALDLEQQRARLAKEQADKLARERLADEGRLLDAGEVKDAIVRMVSVANTRLGAVPARWAPIVNPADHRLARRHLEIAIEEVRAELRTLDFSERADAAA